MPTISWFFGIAIRMYFRDHPPPHFQAVYNEFEANVSIETGKIIEGRLPKVAAQLVEEWTLARHGQLLENGRRARANRSKGSLAQMLTKVTHLEKLGGFRLRIRFNDDSEGAHDFSAMVCEQGLMLEPLRDEAYFARVFLEFGAPTWPNGFDIAPEWLRREMADAGELASTAA